MKKIIVISLIILIILVIPISGGIFYLNNVYLPKTIKSLIIKGIEEQTNTRVTLDSVKVNIFKGLVLKNVSLSYEQGTILRVKEASCIFLPWALLHKEVIIPNININSAEIFIKRKKDGTFNLQELFFIEPPKKEEPLSYLSAAASPTYIGVGSAPAEQGFSISVYRVRVSDSKIIFEDDTLEEPFIKSIDNLDLVAHLSLPASLKFKLSGQIQANPLSTFTAFGEFKLPEKELDVKLALNNISPKDFAPYYKNSGLLITEGLLKGLMSLKLKDNALNCDYQLNVKGLSLVKEKVIIKANLDAAAFLKYSFADNLLKHSGSVVIRDTYVRGIDVIDEISNINSQVVFDDAGLSSDKISANILGLPVEAKLKLNNFSDPDIILNATVRLDLAAFQKVLKDKYKLTLPGAFSGQGDLSLSAGGKPFGKDKLNIIGYFDFINAAVKLDKLDEPIQNILGRVAFTQDQAQWKDLSLKFQELTYKSDGSVTNFKAPAIELKLNSNDLALLAAFSVNDKLISITKCQGHYLASDFSLSGDVDISDTQKPRLALGGALLVNLEDLFRLLPKAKNELDKIKPQGKVHLQFNLAGNINDIKSCAIEAKASSDEFSLYGLKGNEFALNYNQLEGIIDVPFARLSLYGGSLSAAFKANIKSDNSPYTLNFGIQNVLIEELKKDTEAKDKDISGIIQGEFKSNGSLGALLDSEGAGTLSISKGRLWELDLFKGLGKLLLVNDFTSIVFSEGNCAFILKDRFVSTDSLVMKSNMVDLSGPVKIGFDNSIKAVLDVTMVSGYAPSSGTFKDVTTVLLQGTNKFGVIKISGTLKEPKYKFEAAVTDIIKGLSDIFLKKKNSD